jgi:hypothetical protein
MLSQRVIMNGAFETRVREGARLLIGPLVLSLACLLVLLLISWSAVGISKAAAWSIQAAPPEHRVDDEVQRLRSAARAGDVSSTRLLVATLLERYEARGDSAALQEAFDRLAQSWSGDAAFEPEAAQAYVARYCGHDALASHPFCDEDE